MLLEQQQEALWTSVVGRTVWTVSKWLSALNVRFCWDRQKFTPHRNDERLFQHPSGILVLSCHSSSDFQIFTKHKTHLFKAEAHGVERSGEDRIPVLMLRLGTSTEPWGDDAGAHRSRQPHPLLPDWVLSDPGVCGKCCRFQSRCIFSYVCCY